MDNIVPKTDQEDSSENPSNENNIYQINLYWNNAEIYRAIPRSIRQLRDRIIEEPAPKR